MDPRYLRQFVNDFDWAFIFDENGSLLTTADQCTRITALTNTHTALINMHQHCMRIYPIDFSGKDMTLAENKILLIHVYGLCLNAYASACRTLGIAPTRLRFGFSPVSATPKAASLVAAAATTEE